jgi:NAD(P)-dependent dehydrogenase (short-subunit alcohol dehydrogenase family)
MNRFDLSDKVAIITGAGSGNGKAFSKALREQGASVIEIDLVFNDSENMADRLIGSVLETDLIEKAIDRAILSSKKLILVNNAGITMPSSGHYSIESWDKTIAVNLTGPYLWMEAVRKNAESFSSCSIINITSLAAERAFPDNPAYLASKGGLKMLSKAYSEELSPFGFRVNCLGPGYIKTPMTSKSYEDESKRNARIRQTLLGRWGESEDLVGTLIFLASDASSYITGQDIYVDGGWLSKGLIQ